MSVDRDVWLSEVFGHAVFKATPPAEPVEGVSAESVREALLAAAGKGPAFFFCKVAVEQVGLVQVMTKAGFYVVDVNATFERAPARVKEPPVEGTTIVREISPAQREAVLEIAATCFVYSRFHLDPYIPERTAHATKRAWIDNYIRKARGEELLVALTDGEPSGFLAILATKVGEKVVRVHDLLGVDKRRQGRGIGGSLISTSVNDDVEKCDLLKMGTQAANATSIRLYERCGFRYTGASYVLHAHVRDGGLLA